MNSNLGDDILVVDDEGCIRDLLVRTLQSAGYTVRTATNSHEALRLIADSEPAVLICDVHMPGPDGLWLLHQVSAQSSRVAMVLETSDHWIPPVETLREGVVAYLLKPYSRADVLSAVAAGYRWWAQRGGELPRFELPRQAVVEAAEVPAPTPVATVPVPRQPWPWRLAAAMLLGAALMAVAVFAWHHLTPKAPADAVVVDVQRV